MPADPHRCSCVMCLRRQRRRLSTSLPTRSAALPTARLEAAVMAGWDRCRRQRRRRGGRASLSRSRPATSRPSVRTPPRVAPAPSSHFLSDPSARHLLLTLYADGSLLLWPVVWPVSPSSFSDPICRQVTSSLARHLLVRPLWSSPYNTSGLSIKLTLHPNTNPKLQANPKPDLFLVEHSMVANFLRNIYVRLCKHVTRSGLLNNVLYDVAKVFCYLF